MITEVLSRLQDQTEGTECYASKVWPSLLECCPYKKHHATYQVPFLVSWNIQQYRQSTDQNIIPTCNLLHLLVLAVPNATEKEKIYVDLNGSSLKKSLQILQSLYLEKSCFNFSFLMLSQILYYRSHFGLSTNLNSNTFLTPFSHGQGFREAVQV